LVLVSKQSEGGALCWPVVVEVVPRLTLVEFAALFDDIDCRCVQSLREIPKPNVPVRNRQCAPRMLTDVAPVL